MKKIVLFIGLGFFLWKCDTLNQVLETPAGGAAPLTNTEVISGLKEALKVGINNSSSNASKMDGFFKNSAIKLPFPPDAIKVKETVEKIGLTSQVQKFEMTLNRAAEEACKEAKPIFVDAIMGMSISDGFAILKGGDNAATNFLKDKTTSKLISAFSPKVSNAIEKVELTKYWEPLAKAYNTATLLTGGKEVNPDLENYVTGKAVDGLFMLMADEETKIRKDPAARVTSILKRVFGSLD